MAQPMKNGKVAKKRLPTGLACASVGMRSVLISWRWECSTPCRGTRLPWGHARWARTPRRRNPRSRRWGDVEVAHAEAAESPVLSETEVRSSCLHRAGCTRSLALRTRRSTHGGLSKIRPASLPSAGGFTCAITTWPSRCRMVGMWPSTITPTASPTPRPFRTSAARLPPRSSSGRWPTPKSQGIAAQRILTDNEGC